MISATRLFLHDVNIASTTALQALADDGRERGILAGANVIMPNTTDTEYRRGYQLYENKPSLDENTEESRDNLVARIKSIGETINWDQQGTSPHYLVRHGKL
jgi:biotin synthase